MFSTTPVGVTPASKRIVRSRPPVVTRTSAEKPGSAISASGRPSSVTADAARGRARWWSQVVRPTCWRREEQRIGQVVHQDRDPDAVDRFERDGDHEVKDATRDGSATADERMTTPLAATDQRGLTSTGPTTRLGLGPRTAIHAVPAWLCRWDAPAGAIEPALPAGERTRDAAVPTDSLWLTRYASRQSRADRWAVVRDDVA